MQSGLKTSVQVNTRGDTTYTFSSIEKEEYGKVYDFLKGKKINVKSTGKMDASSSIKLADDIDHNLAKVGCVKHGRCYLRNACGINSVPSTFYLKTKSLCLSGSKVQLRLESIFSLISSQLTL